MLMKKAISNPIGRKGGGQDRCLISLRISIGSWLGEPGTIGNHYYGRLERFLDHSVTTDEFYKLVSADVEKRVFLRHLIPVIISIDNDEDRMRLIEGFTHSCKTPAEKKDLANAIRREEIYRALKR